MNEFNDFENRSEPFEGEVVGHGWGSGWQDFTLEDERNAKKRFSKFFLAAFVYIVLASVLYTACTVALTFVLGIEKAEAFMANPYFDITASFVFMYVIALPVFLLMTRRMRPVARYKTPLRAKDFGVLFLIAEACMMVGSFVGTYVYSIISAVLGIEMTDNVADLVYNSPTWLLIIVAVIIGPIVEELMFRKLLMDKLGMYGDRLVIFVSGISFGIFHGDINQIFYATLIGLVLAYIYSRTGNVLYCIGLHMILKFLGSVIPLLLYDSTERFYELYDLMLAGEAVNEAELARLFLIVGSYSLVIYAMVIAGVILFFRKRRSFFVSDRCEVLIPKKRIFSVTVLNAGSIVFICYCAYSVIANVLAPLIMAAAGG